MIVTIFAPIPIDDERRSAGAEQSGVTILWYILGGGLGLRICI